MKASRRTFIRNCTWAGAASLMAGPGQAKGEAPGWRMPDESAPHLRTWMVFGPQAKIWGKSLVPEVQRNLARIANIISEFEPVSLLVRESERMEAQKLVSEQVELVVAEMDDLWARDTAPLFVKNSAGKRAAVDFNFNGWGGKQQHAQDRKVARLIAKEAGVPVLETDLVLEGGCIEVDGEGTAIIAESCVINGNRNPGLTKQEFETRIQPLLGIDKVIWIPGIRGEDITDGHTDFYARFVGPGVLLAAYDPDPDSFDHDITLEHLEILEQATDVAGKPLQVSVLQHPGTTRTTFRTQDFAAGYIGYYVCNGAVLVQEFGDEQQDQKSQEILQQVYPDRDIIALNVDGIAAGGGSIHCATQQEPA
ncbi:MAG: agmatine deiminase family protein [Verrucomicrobiota bacterium]